MSGELWDWGDDGKPEHQVSYAEKMAAQKAHMETVLAELDASYLAEKQRLADFEVQAVEVIAAAKAKTDHEVIWLGYLPTAWKTEIKALTGKRIVKEDTIRISDVVRPSDWESWKRILLKNLCVLRLTKNEAMMAKLTDRGKLWRMVDDPTGSIWTKLALATFAIRRGVMTHEAIDDYIIAINQYYKDYPSTYVLSTDLIATRRANVIGDEYQRQRSSLQRTIDALATKATV